MKRVQRVVVAAVAALVVGVAGTGAGHGADRRGLQERLERVVDGGALGAMVEVWDERGVWRASSGVGELGTGRGCRLGASPGGAYQQDVPGQRRPATCRRGRVGAGQHRRGLAARGRARRCGDDAAAASQPHQRGVRLRPTLPMPPGQEFVKNRTQAAGGGPGPPTSWCGGPWPTRRPSSRRGRGTRTPTPATSSLARSSRRRPGGRTPTRPRQGRQLVGAHRLRHAAARPRTLQSRARDRCAGDGAGRLRGPAGTPGAARSGTAENDGITDLVEAAWRKILMAAEDSTRLVGSQFVEPYAEMVRAAYAEPRLRQLFPLVGMWELHFSRCTEIRYTWDIPYVAGEGGAVPGFESEPRGVRRPREHRGGSDRDGRGAAAAGLRPRLRRYSGGACRVREGTRHQVGAHGSDGGERRGMGAAPGRIGRRVGGVCLLSRSRCSPAASARWPAPSARPAAWSSAGRPTTSG